MVMKRNIGLADRYCRITAGAAILGCGIAESVKGQKWTGAALSLLGGMFLADGILGTCPLYEPLHIDTRAPAPDEKES